MLAAIVAWIFVRPFAREAAHKRHELKARQRARNLKFSRAERAYNAAHLPAEYRK